MAYRSIFSAPVNWETNTDLYGYPNTHKNQVNPPLRPIVSHVGTVTYNRAKWLNETIVKYLDKKFMVNSTCEFIRLSQTINNPKILASLDVGSLLTNVPVVETIKVICDAVYNHPNIAPPRIIPRDALEQLLYICTTKTPFKTPWGDLYAQTKGVSMGKPLGPTFANFYASWLENKVFTENSTITPKVYCRSMDDIFVVVEKFVELKILQTTFENNFVVKFTYEIEQEKEILFIDVLIFGNADNVNTYV